ncbi:hypothetical protein AVEN_103561-1 [Araneus ventricosus]|uniref:Uncharacterized protein n=1 Tax=Araneus ventricosus TaxID=182803 RepID=A0A4Y2G6I1_ARAVE|nr:hypothetical protein AVEN_103561-1 [Araneus ventricosus]
MVQTSNFTPHRQWEARRPPVEITFTPSSSYIPNWTVSHHAHENDLQHRWLPPTTTKTFIRRPRLPPSTHNPDINAFRSFSVPVQLTSRTASRTVIQGRVAAHQIILSIMPPHPPPLQKKLSVKLLN